MPMHVTAGKIKNLWRTDDEAVLHEVKNLWTDKGQIFSSGPEIIEIPFNLTGLQGYGTSHPLVSLTVPPGETWEILIQGTFRGTYFPSYEQRPRLRIGGSTSPYFNAGAAQYEGVVTAASPTVAVITGNLGDAFSFSGTVTVTKP